MGVMMWFMMRGMHGTGDMRDMHDRNGSHLLSHPGVMRHDTQPELRLDARRERSSEMWLAPSSAARSDREEQA